jgi:hypothetical protein
VKSNGDASTGPRGKAVLVSESQFTLWANDGSLDTLLIRSTGVGLNRSSWNCEALKGDAGDQRTGGAVARRFM